MINRVNGINFTGDLQYHYMAVGYRQKITFAGRVYLGQLYAIFYWVHSLKNIRQNYLSKLKVSIKILERKRRVSGRVYDREITACRVPITVERKKAITGRTKRPVRMEYLDDIELSEFKELPTYKRFCLFVF